MSDAPVETTRRMALRGVFLEPLESGEAGRWFFIALSCFVLGQLLSVVAILLAAALSGHSSEVAALAKLSAPPGWYVASSLLGLWAGFLVAPVLVSRSRVGVKRSLGLAVRPLDLLGVPIGLGLQLVVGLLYKPFIQHLQHFNAPIEKLAGGSHGASYSLIVVMTVLGAPIVEELFFRGVLLRSLEGLTLSVSRPSTRGVAIGVAVVLDGLLFAASHGELVQLPGLVLVGAVLSVLYLWTGRLGMSIVTHMTFNGVAMAAYSSSGLILWLH